MFVQKTFLSNHNHNMHNHIMHVITHVEFKLYMQSVEECKKFICRSDLYAANNPCLLADDSFVALPCVSLEERIGSKNAVSVENHQTTQLNVHL